MDKVDVLTVASLIEALKGCEPTARVVIAGREGGLFDIVGTQPAYVALHVNSVPGSGPHDFAGISPAPGVPAVILRRNA